MCLSSFTIWVGELELIGFSIKSFEYSEDLRIVYIYVHVFERFRTLLVLVLIFFIYLIFILVLTFYGKFVLLLPVTKPNTKSPSAVTEQQGTSTEDACN